MAKLADAADLKSAFVRSAGSSPAMLRQLNQLPLRGNCHKQNLILAKY